MRPAVSANQMSFDVGLGGVLLANMLVAVRGAEKGRHSGRFDGAMESPSLADGKTPSAGTRYVLYISF
jgi:hypothetical protein